MTIGSFLSLRNPYMIIALSVLCGSAVLAIAKWVALVERGPFSIAERMIPE